MTDSEPATPAGLNDVEVAFGTQAVSLVPPGDGLVESWRRSALSHAIAVPPGDLDQQGWSKGGIGAFDQRDASSKSESVGVLVEPVGSGALTAIVSWRQAPRPIATQLAVLLTAS